MLEERSKNPAWKIRFWKLIYKVYKSNTGIGSIFTNRITPLGYIVAIALIFSGSLRLGGGRNFLFAVIALLAALLLCSFCFVFFRRVSLEVKRDLPSKASVNCPLTYTVQVTNCKKTAISSAYLRELAHHSIPTEDIFVYSVEPGEEQRNAFDRMFVVYRWKWLTDNRIPFRGDDSAPVLLKGKETKNFNMTLVPMRRGRLELCNMHSMLPDPLHLFQRSVRANQNNDYVLVIPKRYKIKSISMQGFSQDQMGGEAQSSQIGQSTEFVGLRDYRAGDPIKHIDWKSWAKTGAPVIREYEELYFPRHGLVMDTGMHPVLHEHFEEVVSIATSFACSLDTEVGMLDLLLMQQNSKVLTVGKGINKLDHMLEVLACVELETKPNWEELTKDVIQLAPTFSGCIMVFGDWSKERASLVNRVHAMGVTVMCLLVYSDQQEVEELINDVGCRAPVHLLKVDQIQEHLDLALQSF